MHHLVQAAFALAASTGSVAAQQIPGYSKHSDYAGREIFYATSPAVYPAPAGSGVGYTIGGSWDQAYAQAAAFVQTLTLTQKVNLTTGNGWLYGRCLGNTGTAGPNFNGICLMDSPLGVRGTDGNTVFPALSQVAKSWDRKLIYEHGLAMGQEFKAKGAHVQLGPVVGPLGTFPLGGRVWEGYSPDSYLSGVGVAQTVLGEQDAGVQATVKHYIGNEQEHFRQVGETYSESPVKIEEALSSYIDDRAMHETYLWPFADAVRAGVSAVMCSYNQVNNSYACQNSKLLNGLLKDELGFQGYVMSDWAATKSGVAAIEAGLDMSMPGDISFDSGNTYFGGNLTLAVLNDTLSEDRLNDMAIRIMAPYFRLRQNENYPRVSIRALEVGTNAKEYPGAPEMPLNEHIDVRGNHSDVAFRAARDSIVLLKNVNRTLPLGHTRRLAVIGDDAGDNPWGANFCGDRNCDRGTLGTGWGSGTANYPYLISPIEAIAQRARASRTDFFAVTDHWNGGAVRQNAQLATTTIVFVNAMSGEGYISIDQNYGDRNNFTLWNEGELVIRQAADGCENTIVVIHSVGPVDMDSWISHPNIKAVLWAGLPGQESGNSIASVLYGDYNPSGKLTFTISRNLEDYGPGIMYNPNALIPQQNLSALIDYKYFDTQGIEPLYPFGFGLSYTNFTISGCSTKQLSNAAYKPRSAAPVGKPPQLPPTKTTPDQAVFPKDFNRISGWIYSYIESAGLVTSSANATSSSASAKHASPGNATFSELPQSPAGGGPGGNPSLYDVLFRTTCTVTNIGQVAGQEVVQLYLGFPPSKDFPTAPNQLRGFDKIALQPGQSGTVSFDTTRRDMSVWSTHDQNWKILTDGPYAFRVGQHSRSLETVASLSPNIQP